MQDKKATLIEHLEELRRRLLVSLIAIGAAALISYLHIDKILSLFTVFFDKIVFIAPQEAFVTYIKISFFSGLLLASPVVIFNIWRFVETALTKLERHYLIFYGLSSFALFAGGVVFCYYVILPWALRFLLSFQSEKIVPMITLGNMTTFCMILLLSFAIVFELPLATVFLSQVGLVNPLSLRKKRKYVILAVFILSAFVTPPDAVTQVLLAVPLIGLYEIGILFSRLVTRKKELGG